MNKSIVKHCINMNTFGAFFKVTVFGESHGPAVGVVCDGFPAGIEFDLNAIRTQLERRRPGQSKLSTQRSEADEPEVLSGVYKGRSTGAPIALLFRNKDTRSQDYEKISLAPRPGHADYSAHEKYNGFNDPRGGGMFSGRLTLGVVAAGALARTALAPKGIRIAAHAREIAGIDAGSFSVKEIEKNVEKNQVRCADAKKAKLMQKRIEDAKEAGDSVGGTVECVAEGLPPGIGEPLYAKLDAQLAHAMLSLPGAKAFEVGETKPRGSLNNDEFRVKNGKITATTNNAGGVLGGISNGMPLVFRVKFKPTSSIAKKQNTVDLHRMKKTSINVQGRHDPCIVPRAVPVVENAAACVLLDAALMAGVVERVTK